MSASAIMRQTGVKRERRAGLSRFVIHGGRPLQGEIRASGSKNAVLPMIAAALLTDEEVVLENVPSIRDVDVMLEIAGQIGADVSRAGDRIVIRAANLGDQTLPADLCERVRTSVGDSPAESSIKSLQLFLRILLATERLSQSRSSNAPVLRRVASIPPIEANERINNDCEGISILNTSTGFSPWIAACSAIFIATVVFPIEGRPATMTKSESCKPEVILSKSLKPVARPVIPPLDF